MVESETSCNSSVTIKFRKLTPYISTEIKVLLLENVHPDAVALFKEAGFQVFSAMLRRFYEAS